MKILIADDEAGVVDLLLEFFRERDIPADSAFEGREALRMAKNGAYDVVFLDINMPGLTGLEILKHVKDNTPGTKVVFLTGYPCVTENFVKALRADDYMEKPIDLKAIGNIVDKYAARK